MKKLILVIVILSTTHCYTMKRQRSYPQKIYDTKKRKLVFNKIISLPKVLRVPKVPLLPQDMLNLIVNLAIYNPNTKKPKEATKTIRALTVTTKDLNKKMNRLDFSDNLINHYSLHFRCSHESIAKFLTTKPARERLALQYDLKKVCLYSSEAFISGTIDTVLREEKKLNLEFTYNDHSGLPKTPLMLSMHRNSWIFSLFLDHKANVNTRNAHGMTALHLAASYPIQPYATSIIINRPELFVDQQNNRGETALLYSLKNRKKANITVIFIQTIENLLTKADPELTDKEKNSPLSVAQELGNLRIIDLIDRAIIRKREKQQQIAT